jgi:hypothetical protein
MSQTISVTGLNTNPPKKTSSNGSVFGLILICVLFAIPLGLVYNMFFYKKKGFMPNLWLAIFTYLLGFTATLLYYRIVIMNDPEAKINKISKKTAGVIAGTTFFAFKIVAVTIIALAVNPNLVTIFENTLGYGFAKIMGLSDLTRRIFKPMHGLDELQDEKGLNVFNFDYNFLITCMSVNNVAEFLKCYEDGVSHPPLPFDFTMSLGTKENAQKLENFVYMKYTFGHFVWIYFTAIISLIISMVAVTMNG